MSSEYREMPPKLADKVKRIGSDGDRCLATPATGPMPNLSEAYRRLIEKGLEAEAKGKKKAPKS